MQQHTTTGTHAATRCGSLLHANRGTFADAKQIWAARPGRWNS